MGEPPLFLSASVFYAIKDAIYAARKESGLTEVFRLDSPATPERIRNACVDTFTKMVTVPGLTGCSLANLPHRECAWKSQGPGAGIRAGWGGCVPAPIDGFWLVGVILHLTCHQLRAKCKPSSAGAPTVGGAAVQDL